MLVMNFQSSVDDKAVHVFEGEVMSECYLFILLTLSYDVYL